MSRNRAATEAAPERVELEVRGMDCAGCARSVQQALSEVPGVENADVLLSAERAVVDVKAGTSVSHEELQRAVERAGYTVAKETESESDTDTGARRLLATFGIVFGVVLLVVVAGEWLGLFGAVTERVPTWLGTLVVLASGFHVFKPVVQAAFRGQVVVHTLMAVGAAAALLVGEWVTAGVVVLFMWVGDRIEHMTTQKTRDSVRSLTEMAPQTARIQREDEEITLPISEVQKNDTVIVRPGEQIPIDGTVTSGQATINQAAITGESMPVDVEAGDQVYAASIAQYGSLRVRATGIGPHSTFGRVIRLIEEAESHRGPIQRYADRFSTYYLPIVLAVAAGTYWISGNVMATVAVLVVSCSCAFALATPVALLASIGSAARQGLLIKGGKYLERLAQADVLLVDKTGTLTLGEPQITEVVPLNGLPEDDLLALAASAERYSEHPLAEAVRQAASNRGLEAVEPETFEALPGRGVRARVRGRNVVIGNSRLVEAPIPAAEALQARGKTSLIVEVDGEIAGVLAAEDTQRENVSGAFDALREYGIQHIELLTGDHERAAAPLAEQLGIDYRADLLPEDKIDVVRAYQARGHTVVMIGDGVNDAPALAQADIGIAMGLAGADVSIEVAPITLLREDWRLVPELFSITQRAMGAVRFNLGFTAVYSLAGLTLAAAGILPPILAAAAQSLPDLGVMANSARLLR